jgi:hypothetical protein
MILFPSHREVFFWGGILAYLTMLLVSRLHDVGRHNEI